MSDKKINSAEIDTSKVSAIKEGSDGEVITENPEKDNEKLLTQEQFETALKERLERERRKILKEAQEKIEEERQEAERLAKLSAEEKEKELIKKTEDEIREREQQVAIRENRIEAVELFQKSSVPVELVSYVIDVDKDKTLENADNFIKKYKESVSKTVAEQLKGVAPKDLKSETKEPVKVVTSF